MLNVGAVWVGVEVFTGYQVVAGEMHVRGRFQQHMNDAEPYTPMRSVTTTPLLPGAPRLNGIPEGLLAKQYFCAVRTIDPEPPHPDELPDRTARYIYFQGAAFTAKGTVEFPAAADPSLHRDTLFKVRFFPVLDATLSVVGVEGHTLNWPHAYVNRDLMLAVYLD